MTHRVHYAQLCFLVLEKLFSRNSIPFLCSNWYNFWNVIHHKRVCLQHIGHIIDRNKITLSVIADSIKRKKAYVKPYAKIVTWDVVRDVTELAKWIWVRSISIDIADINVIIYKHHSRLELFRHTKHMFFYAPLPPITLFDFSWSENIAGLINS